MGSKRGELAVDAPSAGPQLSSGRSIQRLPAQSWGRGAAVGLDAIGISRLGPAGSRLVREGLTVILVFSSGHCLRYRILIPTFICF
jgi:hypothetical protein